jgi:hypothetical protein
VVTNADEVLAWFRESGAVHDGHFRYTSGRHGDTYFEKFQVLQHPEYTVKLCALIAQRFKASGATLVAGPTTGGVILGFEVARQLGLRSIFAERAEGGGRTFGRGFRRRQDRLRRAVFRLHEPRSGVLPAGRMPPVHGRRSAYRNLRPPQPAAPMLLPSPA